MALSKYQITLLLLTILINPLFSQEITEDNWDNELWTGLKFDWGKDKLKYSVEYQPRFNDNYNNLERWYIEGAVHYLGFKHLEIIPDFRYSVRQNNNEYRFGLGFVYKYNFNKWLIINQFKGQIDKPAGLSESYALREVAYLNYVLNDKWIPYIGGGIFYRNSDNFNGIQVIRAGAGVYYNFKPLHSLSVNYFVGKRDLGNSITYSGILLIQLTLKFSDDFDYLPAQYVNF